MILEVVDIEELDEPGWTDDPITNTVPSTALAAIRNQRIRNPNVSARRSRDAMRGPVPAGVLRCLGDRRSRCGSATCSGSA